MLGISRAVGCSTVLNGSYHSRKVIFHRESHAYPQSKPRYDYLSNTVRVGCILGGTGWRDEGIGIAS